MKACLTRTQPAHSMPKKPETFTILQYNLRKSFDSLKELFEKEIKEIKEIDVIAIQEPPKRVTNSDRNLNPSSDYFHLVIEETDCPRTSIYINKEIALSSWYTSHLSGNRISTRLSMKGERDIEIHNIYNPVAEENNSVIPDLMQAIRRNPDGEHIALGDYNLHHPSWGGEEARTDAAAEDLLVEMGGAGLEQLLAAGTVTWSEWGLKTTIDLIFATPLLTDTMTKCGLYDPLNIHSDHYPIMTTFELGTKQTQPLTKYNWSKINETHLRRELSRAILGSQIIQDFVNKEVPVRWEGIDKMTAEIVDTIQEAVLLSTLRLRVSPHSKPGFTSECKEAVQAANRCWRQRDRFWSEDTEAKYRKARNDKVRVLRKARRACFRKWITEACESPEIMWKKTKWARKPSLKQTCLPSFVANGEVIHKPKRKAKILMESFFPPPVHADLSDVNENTYPRPHNMGEITRNEIARAVLKPSPKKAPGLDDIPNLILQKTLDIMLPIYEKLFNKCLETGYCPQHFRDSITVAIRKPGKGDYLGVLRLYGNCSCAITIAVSRAR